MIRCVRILLGLSLILMLSGRDARAQWGYGGWGWGGWGGGGTTAQTPRSRAPAITRWGRAGITSTPPRPEHQRPDGDAVERLRGAGHPRIGPDSRDARAQRIPENQALYDAHQKSLRENPGKVEIENGDALNAAVEDLSDPRLGSSALRAAKAPVPASLIAEVPFQNASERVTLMLDAPAVAVKWPDVFERPRFANGQEGLR